MKYNQQAHLSQNQRQAYLPNLVQNIQLLQLNRVELSAYLNNLILSNPLIDMPESEQRLIQHALKDSDSVIEQTAVQKPSLFDTLKEQIEMLYRPTYLRELIFWWINQLDHRGYVTVTIDEATEETGATAVELLDALVLLQQLDPPGIGARSLQECLLLQTERHDLSPPTAYIILEESFDLLTDKKWQVLGDKYDLTVDEVKEVFSFVQTLNPSPAEVFQPPYTPFILPELGVQFNNGELSVKETRYKTPLLSFNTEYYQELKRQEDPEVQQYIREKKRECEALQAGLVKRGETILAVGIAIVEHQRPFFSDSQRSLLPLQLNDLAQKLQLDVSTVSRAVRETYIRTPAGTFELKSFLSRRSADGRSSDELDKALIQLVENEDKQKPYSDQLLSDLLNAKGMTLSRRGVAKYRSRLAIPPSTQRKE
ncbi:RNA polymerase sigma-54 factor RpoN [Alkalibacterium sp. AK22]|uniref:RNA polymerase factor sigma-54 n=1 Tax=Alkalibacterium sp. AK22 TaxID=1229520 RepID=UPI00044B1E24|nr:RNA polymerase factor sigma-54 [Alkalibacterium sp. AK22]EXJ23184.1 RNA polymerase sigma-54 factor RpoN [Alkalibacterium sp. AK22]